jgi:hypothetical protein
MLIKNKHRRSNTEVCQWYAVTCLVLYRRGLARRNFIQDSWNDLATTGTPEFLNSKAGEILSTSPAYIVHAVGHRPHAALTCLPVKFMHPHRMEDG